MQDTFARATHSAYKGQAARPSARATIGYLVYKEKLDQFSYTAVSYEQISFADDLSCKIILNLRHEGRFGI